MKTMIAVLVVARRGGSRGPRGRGRPAATSPAQACKTELKAMGATDFKALYAPGARARTRWASACRSTRAPMPRTSRTRRRPARPSRRWQRPTSGRRTAASRSPRPTARTTTTRTPTASASPRRRGKAETQQEAATMKASKACKAERGRRPSPRGVHRQVRRQGGVGVRQVRLREEQEAVAGRGLGSHSSGLKLGGSAVGERGGREPSPFSIAAELGCPKSASLSYRTARSILQPTRCGGVLTYVEV